MVQTTPRSSISLHESQSILDQIEALMLDEEASDEQIEALAEQYLEAAELTEAAVERYCHVIQKRKRRFDIRDAEAKSVFNQAKELRQLASRDDNLCRRLKGQLQQFMQSRGISKFETDLFSLVDRANGGKPGLEIDEEYDLAELLENYPHLLKVELDEALVRKVLEDGADLPFARFKERGRSLIIKPL